MQRHLGWIVLAGAAAAMWGACQSPTATGGVLLTGQWGSAQGRFTATQVTTVFNGACGSGSTNEPLMLDKKGRFELTGLYGASGTAQVGARFRGAVSSKTLTLRVLKSDSTEAVPTIVLNLGQQPALATCH
jgi:hypothetical protein